MPRPIQTIPQGLLGLLQLKQTGRNPTDLLETVQPTMEQLPFLLQRNAVELSLITGGGASFALATASPGLKVFTTNPLIVPQGTMWWVENYTLSGSLLAAETIRLACTITYPTIGTYRLPPYVDFADVITARARQFTAGSGGFWAWPGAQLGFFVADDLTAATITVNGNARGVSIPI